MTVNVAMWSLKPKVERLLDIATKEPNRHLLVRRIFSTMIGFGAQTVVVSNAPCYNSIYDPSCGVYSYGRTTLGCLEVSSEMIPAGKSTHRPGSVTSASSTDRHGNGRKKSPPQGDACCATGEKGAKRSSFPHKDLAPRSACPAERQRQALPVERYLQRPPSSGCPNDAADAGYRAGLRCRSLVLSCCLGRRATTVGVLLALVSGAVCTGLNSREQVPGMSYFGGALATRKRELGWLCELDDTFYTPLQQLHDILIDLLYYCKALWVRNDTSAIM